MPSAKDKAIEAAKKKILAKLTDRGSIDDSPCFRGKEVPALLVPVRRTDDVDLNLYFCGGLALAVVLLTDRGGNQRTVGEVMVDDRGVSMQVPVSTLTPGRWVLTWVWFHEVSGDWLMTSEVEVNSATMFRLYKSEPGNLPTNKLTLYLDVS